MNVVFKPELIESNVKYFLNSTLENSHKFKEKYFISKYSVW